MDKTKKNIRLLIFFYLANVALRLVALLELRAFPDFYAPTPSMNADIYYFLAELMRLKSPLVAAEPYYYSPLYAHYMRALTAIFGENPYAPRIINILVGSTVPIGIYLMAKELLASKKAAGFAAFGALFLASFYDMFIFYDNQVIKTTFLMALITWGLYFLITPPKPPLAKGGIGGVALGGALLGAAVLLQGNVLLFVAAMSAILLIKRRPKEAAAFAIAAGLVVAPAVIRNYVVSKNLTITAVDGIHFYIGNNERAKGIYMNLPRIRPNTFGHYFDAKKAVEEELKAKGLPQVSPSKYFKGKVYEFIKKNPIGYVRLLGRKLLIAFNRYDVPNNDSLSYVKSKAFFMRYFTIPFWILGSLGLAGLLLSLFDRKKGAGLSDKSGVLLAFTAAYLLALILSFVNGRYRLPLVIPLAVYAAYFFSYLFENAGDMKRKVLAAAVVVAVFLVVNLDLDLGQDKFARSTEAKMRASAEAQMLKAEMLKAEMLKAEMKKAEDPRRLSALWVRLGDLYLKTGGREQGRYYYYKAFKADPKNEEAELMYYKLGIMGIKPVVPDE